MSTILISWGSREKCDHLHHQDLSLCVKVHTIGILDCSPSPDCSQLISWSRQINKVIKLTNMDELQRSGWWRRKTLPWSGRRDRSTIFIVDDYVCYPQFAGSGSLSGVNNSIRGDLIFLWSAVWGGCVLRSFYRRVLVHNNEPLADQGTHQWVICMEWHVRWQTLQFKGFLNRSCRPESKSKYLNLTKMTFWARYSAKSLQKDNPKQPKTTPKYSEIWILGLAPYIGT